MTQKILCIARIVTDIVYNGKGSYVSKCHQNADKRVDKAVYLENLTDTTLPNHAQLPSTKLVFSY